MSDSTGVGRSIVQTALSAADQCGGRDVNSRIMFTQACSKVLETSKKWVEGFDQNTNQQHVSYFTQPPP